MSVSFPLFVVKRTQESLSAHSDDLLHATESAASKRNSTNGGEQREPHLSVSRTGRCGGGEGSRPPKGLVVKGGRKAKRPVDVDDDSHPVGGKMLLCPGLSVGVKPSAVVSASNPTVLLQFFVDRVGVT